MMPTLKAVEEVLVPPRRPFLGFGNHNSQQGMSSAFLRSHAEEKTANFEAVVWR